ncbi:MAG: bifunctional diguanylate cyclase/phosphodiesterase [Pseudomonadota bacterium]|nr:bifunctional diguanylate cyclase/phosphodiesterase [Pseudomonadota bacterium]
MNLLEDELTGLHNRRGFQSLLQRHVQNANQRQNNLALIVIDVDGMSRLNGAHGYAFGDAVLQHVARQIGAAARSHDYAARIDGNRFALILTRLLNVGHAELAIQKLYRLLDVPMRHADQSVRVSVTAGVAVCPTHATHADFLLRLAERAVEMARSAEQHYAFAREASLDQGLADAWDLEIEMESALDRGELSMHYQPQIRIADGYPVGVEALMRWTSPTKGSVPPDIFIPIAERTGHIKKLTVWAINTVFRQSSHWSHPWGPLSVAVNIPADLVVQEDLPDLVANAAKLWGTPDIHLMLEITERSLMDPKRSFEILRRIRESGTRVSIDDFGTGYSSLAYFRDLPVDELKVDRSFVIQLLTDPACSHITNLIIDLAHRFGLAVVAEGVEDEVTLQTLQERGCDIAQGYFFGKAMPSHAIEQWLNAVHAARAGPPGS